MKILNFKHVKRKNFEKKIFKSKLKRFPLFRFRILLWNSSQGKKIIFSQIVKRWRWQKRRQKKAECFSYCTEIQCPVTYCKSPCIESRANKFRQNIVHVHCVDNVRVRIPMVFHHIIINYMVDWYIISYGRLAYHITSYQISSSHTI